MKFTAVKENLSKQSIKVLFQRRNDWINSFSYFALATLSASVCGPEIHSEWFSHWQSGILGNAGPFPGTSKFASILNAFVLIVT